jgi:hypothetical protein
VADSKTSNRVKEQIPQYQRDNNPLFVALMEAYYEYLERSGKALERGKNLRLYADVDTSINSFLSHFYSEFLKFIPRNTNADKSLLLKHIKDFYRARGTEKSYKFLIRLLSSGSNEADFYYPKEDILRASDSTWYIQKVLRLLDMTYDGVRISEQDITQFYLLEGLQITGLNSGAVAIVDKAEHFYDNGFLTDEVTLSSINGQFEAGETVQATYTDDDGIAHTIAAIINPGSIGSATVRNGGYGYQVGYEIPLEPQGNTAAQGGIIRVKTISTGSINTVSVVYGGSGYRINDGVIFLSDSGSDANAFIATVLDDNTYHSHTYTIESSTISLEANTTIGNSVYTNLNSANANTTVANAINTFQYSNTGPAVFVSVANTGSGFLELPQIVPVGNSRIQAMGILGRMNVISGGTGYANDEVLTFTNVLGGHGEGAAGKVLLVNSSGTILTVQYTPVSGFPLGGMGYDNDHLPSVAVNTVGGSGANIVVNEILGTGAEFAANLTSIGAITSLEVVNGGVGYNVAPILNLTASGSGTANAYANVTLGVYNYPGRYIDDKGHLSSFNFLQDRDYYQNFSYVIRVDESLENYRKAINKLLHPAGLKMFAEYLTTLSDIELSLNVETSAASTAEYYYPACLFFDGNTFFQTDNVTVTSTLQEGIISFWMKPDMIPTTNNHRHRIISFGGGLNTGWVALLNTGTTNTSTGLSIDVVMYQPNGDIAMNFRSHSRVPIGMDDFTHVLISYSGVTSSKTNVWINDVSCRTGGGFFNVSANNLVYSNVSVGGAKGGGTANYRGSLAEVLVSNTWIDLSQTSIRRLFSVNNMPVNLQTGLLSNTSFIPIMYFRSNAASANLNSGSGNSFPIIVGTVTDSNVNPQIELSNVYSYTSSAALAGENMADFSDPDNSYLLTVLL